MFKSGKGQSIEMKDVRSQDVRSCVKDNGLYRRWEVRGQLLNVIN